jgi:hypothetical protein
MQTITDRPVLRQHIAEPSAWKAEELRADPSWVYHLTPVEIAEIEAALQSVKQAAIPLLAVAGGVGLAWLVRAWLAGGRGARLAGLLAGLGLLASAGVGLSEWAQVQGWQAILGPPAAPYAATAPAVRAWVNQHVPANAPLFCYGLDALLYRVLEREPPRPWAPQLPLILRAGDTEARARGLDTCPQAAFTQFHRIIAEQLSLPSTEMLVCGMALGFADPGKVENSLFTERVPVAAFARFLP